MPSKQERLAELQKAMEELENEPDDDREDDEVWIQHPDGHTIGMSFRRAKEYTKRLGFDISTVPVSDPAGSPGKPTKGKPTKSDAGNDGDSGGDDPNNLRFFQRRQQQRDQAAGDAG